jgi:hypothetical protein
MHGSGDDDDDEDSDRSEEVSSMSINVFGIVQQT